MDLQADLSSLDLHVNYRICFDQTQTSRQQAYAMKTLGSRVNISFLISTQWTKCVLMFTSSRVNFKHFKHTSSLFVSCNELICDHFQVRVSVLYLCRRKILFWNFAPWKTVLFYAFWFSYIPTSVRTKNPNPLYLPKST